MLRKFLLSALSIGFFHLGLTCLPAAAQIKVQPLILTDSVQKGKASGILTVSNDTDKEFRSRVYAEPFTYDRDTGFKVLETSKSDLTPYLVYAPRELIVPPRSTRRVRYVVRFPPNHPDGEFRAVIFTETLEEKITSDEETNFIVKFQNRIGTTLYVRSGSLEQKLTAKSTQFDAEKGNIQVLFENAGNATARPKIKWELKNEGQVAYAGEEDETTVIANSERYINLSLTPEVSRNINPREDSSSQPNTIQPKLTPGTYKLLGEVRWDNLGKTEEMKFELDLLVP